MADNYACTCWNSRCPEHTCHCGRIIRETVWFRRLDYVVVTTAHRGVFFGSLESYSSAMKVAVLIEARNAVYWSGSVRGFLGLAANGPNSECRIGPAAPRLVLEGVTSCAECTPEAVEKWKAAPWN